MQGESRGGERVDETDETGSVHVWRDLTSPTRVLTVASAASLFLHLVQAAILWVDPVVDARAIEAALARGVTVGALVELALVLSIIVCAGLSLAWLYRASTNALLLHGRMKYSPRGGVIWFFIPAVNTIMSLSVVYDIWSASGGNKKGGRLVLLWWALAMASIYIVTTWLVGSRIDLITQAVVAGSTLTFMLLARRILALQRFAETGAEFGEPAREVDPAAKPFIPIDTAPHASLERVEPLQQPREYKIASGSSRAAQSVGPAPAPIVVRRPEPGGQAD